MKVWVCLKISERAVNSVIQTVHDGRQFMKYIDPKLGVALPERDYGGNCLIYDPGNETDPFHNLWVRQLFISFKLQLDFTFDESPYQTLAFLFLHYIPSFHLHPLTLALSHSFLWIPHCFIFIESLLLKSSAFFVNEIAWNIFSPSGHVRPQI